MRKLIISLLLAAPLAAQTRVLTVDDYARAESKLGATTNALVFGTAGRPMWLPDGRFAYRATTAAGSAYWLVDPAKKTKVPAFDHARLAAAISATGGPRVDGDHLPLPTFEYSADMKSITYQSPPPRPGRYTCDIVAYTCAAVAMSAQAPRNSVTSPDGKRAAYIRNFNLFVTDLATGVEKQLTTDGIKDFGYATNNAGWVRNDNPVLTWSPDSKKIATFQHDGRGTSEMYLVNTSVGAPTLQAWKYPLPGDSVIFRISRVVIDVDAGKVVRLQMPPDQHRSTVSDHIACGTRICDMQWYPDGSAIAFISSSRDHKQAWMRVADANTGVVRTLFDETSKTQIGDAGGVEGMRPLPASKELIWFSEKENWGHLYLHDLATGTLKNRITQGVGNVENIERIDEKARTIWFVGGGKEVARDPYYLAFYKVGFDGKAQTLLTPENANHSVVLSPDGKYFTDTYSTPVMPPTTVLRDASGKLVLELEKANISKLLATGWKPPTPVTMKARDGKTDIYGLMFTPSTLDSTKKYPIVDYIYPGPQSGSVGPRSFTAARSDHQALAELGFVVVAIDGMGTPGRSKEFHDAYYGDMGDNTLPDQVAGIKELASRYKWIDGDKVGIWGHSGGGFATAGAMFRYPDFFKVGISESGNHDNRNYEDDWGERYQGMLSKTGPSAGADNYADEANQTHARNLKGKLMLAHGGLDGNVPPYNTYLVVDALQRAGKDFDLVIFPNAGHGFGQLTNYMMRRRWDYFVKHLLGAEHPKEYEIGRQRPIP
jgi:dipeptidyl-peptidase-4